MIILKNLFHFNLPITDMLEIYCLYIRSVVEQACVVWHSSLTKGEELDIERIQKVAMRIILQEKLSKLCSCFKNNRYTYTEV